MRSRSEVVKLISSWIGKKEADGSYKEIIDIYNSFTGEFPTIIWTRRILTKNP